MASLKFENAACARRSTSGWLATLCVRSASGCAVVACLSEAAAAYRYPDCLSVLLTVVLVASRYPARVNGEDTAVELDSSSFADSVSAEVIDPATSELRGAASACDACGASSARPTSLEKMFCLMLVLGDGAATSTAVGTRPIGRTGSMYVATNALGPSPAGEVLPNWDSVA